MARMILDIESAGVPFESLDEVSQEYYKKFARRDAADEAEYEALLEEHKNALAFSPLTAETVAIGMLNPETGKGIVTYQAPKKEPAPSSAEGYSLSGVEGFEEEGVQFLPKSEREMLVYFWEAVRQYDQVITFSGRAFDVPFLLARSAIHEVLPTKNLMPNRYKGTTHIDLMDHLTFFGAVRKTGFGLHFWARALGVESPKAGEVHGEDVTRLFHAGEYEKIARYCLGDLKATTALWERWSKYYAMQGEERW